MPSNMPPSAGRHQGSAGERRPRILWKLGAEIEITALVWQQQMVGHTTTTCFQNQNSKPYLFSLDFLKCNIAISGYLSLKLETSVDP